MITKILFITAISIALLLATVSILPIIYIYVLYAIYNIIHTALIFIKNYKFTEIIELTLIIFIIIFNMFVYYS